MMDLDEMKNTWSQMSKELEKQKKLTNEIILKMANQKSKNSLSKIKLLELFGGLIMGTLLLIFMGINLINGTISGLPLTIFTFISSAIFLYSMYSSYSFIQIMNKVNLEENSIEESNENFIAFKSKYQTHKKIGLIMNIPTLIFFLPVVVKIYSGHDLFTNFNEGKTFMLHTLVAGLIISVPLLLFIYRTYKKNVSATTEAHEELTKLND